MMDGIDMQDGENVRSGWRTANTAVMSHMYAVPIMATKLVAAPVQAVPELEK